MPNSGAINDIKDAFNAIVVASSSDLDTTNVTSDQDSINDYLMADNLPFVVVEFKETSSVNVYGRKTPKLGLFYEQPFSLMIFHNRCVESGEKRNKYIMDIADDIKDYLVSNHSSFMSDYIMDIYDISIREAPVGGEGVLILRAIINGRLLILRKDLNTGFPYTFPYKLS
jgi:hypothetical protein